ncbi:protein of unknown function [Candidatus Methylomirabilis oxygeniifera]|uniref:Uncharacterized protein n=1 Tax=Methylomirabilis oxygeniifera TaxID=671143 RepID=D5MGH0_METO1|nr:protein of unknown function [Candidatus Methylomirabilis oxyfera]
MSASATLTTHVPSGSVYATLVRHTIIFWPTHPFSTVTQLACSVSSCMAIATEMVRCYTK